MVLLAPFSFQDCRLIRQFRRAARPLNLGNDLEQVEIEEPHNASERDAGQYGPGFLWAIDVFSDYLVAGGISEHRS